MWKDKKSHTSTRSMAVGGLGIWRTSTLLAHGGASIHVGQTHFSPSAGADMEEGHRASPPGSTKSMGRNDHKPGTIIAPMQAIHTV